MVARVLGDGDFKPLVLWNTAEQTSHLKGIHSENKEISICKWKTSMLLLLRKPMLHFHNLWYQGGWGIVNILRFEGENLCY